MSRQVPVVVGVRALALGHKLHATLDAQVHRRRGTRGPEKPRETLPWSAEFFDLHHVRLFQAADARVQRATLEASTDKLMSEAYAIERLGMAYASKMCLLSETTEERVAYCLMASDEATHLHWITPYVREPVFAEKDPFIELMTSAVEEQSRHVLIYLVQVLLEGWGLSHYRAMADGCSDGDLQRTLRHILIDEAFHVGSGACLFDAGRFTDADRTYMFEFSRSLCRMVQVGPQAVVRSLDEAAGGMTRAERIEVFEELRCRESSLERLETLKKLLSSYPELVSKLDADGAFVPLPASECASQI